MAYRILLTSLHEAEKDNPVRYFYARKGSKYYFCEAFLTVEASTKYILAEHEIDEIIVIGRTMTFDTGDDGRLIRLREGKSFYTSDIRDLSTYSLYRYRIAQYIEELRIEQQDLMDILSDEEKDRAAEYVDSFYRSGNFTEKYNRMFEELAKDRELYRHFASGIREIAGDEATASRFMTWIKGYIYDELKDSGKLEILRENEDVNVRFIPTSLSEEGHLPIDNIMQLKDAIKGNHDEKVEIYAALNNDDMTDNFVLVNILDIINTMNTDLVSLKNIYTTSDSINSLAGEIRDDTLGYGITELASATRTFLKYGKADMLVEYWEKHGAHDEQIEQMIYAMKRIDYGLSLCDIKEMMTGIEILKELFRESEKRDAPVDYYGKLFMVLADGIRNDYGKLMEGDEIELIDLVKWGYKKKFYQQTLTLIESKAPQVIVGKGMYYYCNDEARREHNTYILAQERVSLASRDVWQMNDVDHYFIKYYMRGNGRGGKEDIQRAYAKSRVKGLTATDDNKLIAYTLCDNITALENLLYAYYHVGDIRNATNHAEDNEGEETRLIVGKKDDIIRLVKIREAIEYFISCYDAVASNIEGKELDVVRIDAKEVKAFSGKLEKAD